jgi:hypothetical protein
MKDRLRNKFFRWVGITPRDDFIYFTESVVKVLESFEKFTKASTIFSNAVAEKLGIRFDGEHITEDFEYKSNKEVQKEYSERGMI